MTKKQRNKLYKELLKEVCEDPSTNIGLCYYLTYHYFSLNINQVPPGRVIMKKNFPELYKLAPEKWKLDSNNWYWFPRTPQGWKKRIAIIEKCIELTN